MKRRLARSKREKKQREAAAARRDAGQESPASKQKRERTNSLHLEAKKRRKLEAAQEAAQSDEE